MQRVAAVDCGNVTSGVCVVDFDPAGGHKVVLLEVHTNPTKKASALAGYVEETIVPMLIDHPNPTFAYENTFRPSSRFGNHGTLRIQKSVRAVIDKHKKKVTIRSLQPTQKHAIGSITADRKDKSIEAAKAFLAQHDPRWVPVVDAAPRKHDMTDALLSAIYAYHNPNPCKKAKTAKK